VITDSHKTVHLKIQKFEVTVWAFGNPSHPPIFYIHGFSKGFSNYFGDLPIRHLMKDYYIVAFDLPGFGYSRNINMNKLEFISEVQNKMIKDKKIVLIGISYGGLLSIKYASKFPGKVRALVIAGVPVFHGVFKLLKLSRYLPSYRGLKLKKEMLEEFSFLNEENLSKLRLPVLLYYSRGDYVTNIFMGKKLKRMIPDSKLFIANGQNHQWLMDKINKNGFLEVFQSFLTNTAE
jgi:pimeloyl-ACP methyl ester carboxylesterase